VRVPAPGAPLPAIRYRFDGFLLVPARRQLLAGDVEVRLIPRYLDLLILLVECRHRAVPRQEIFERVWPDVVVSDGALSQAIRTLRRALGDRPREPRFIRTVSRHGYQFVHPAVVEELEDALAEPHLPAAESAPVTSPADGDHTQAEHLRVTNQAAAPSRGELVERLLGHQQDRVMDDEERRDAAEQLHALGTEAAVEAVRGRPGEAGALAMLRDARWDVPGAGTVPLTGARGRVAPLVALVRLRLRRAVHLTARRWAGAAAGGALAGIAGGVIGGLALLLVPASEATASVVVALALVGAVAGGCGAAGVGAGLAAAEALARSQRTAALVVCGALGGAMAGLLAHAAAGAVLASMFGRDGAAIGGALEGLVLGAATGLGYGAATTRLPGGGMASPHGRRRLAAALSAGLCCALAGMVLALLGRHLVAASLDVLASRFEGSTVGLAPLARLLGEQHLRPITRTLLSGMEGLLFGAGLVLGLTRRPLPTR
jgi:DNA-binding winged helix-turn-helix (wHTH) protein